MKLGNALRELRRDLTPEESLEANPLCNRCGKEPRRTPSQRWCLGCHAEWQRMNRKRHGELSEEQRLKSNARSYLHTYIARGKVEKGEHCAACGESPNALLGRIEAHHADYSKPLEVIWLHRRCHLDHHEGFLPYLPEESFK